MVQQLPESVTGQVVKSIGNRERIGTEFDIPEDAYGAMMVVVVRDMTFVLNPQHSASMKALAVQRMTVAIMTMVVNLVLQVGLLYYIHIFVVQPSVRHAQLKYRQFSYEVFDEGGKFSRIAWLEFEDKGELCQIALMNKPFWLIVLCIWTLVMVGEYRDSYRFYRNMAAVPTVTKVQEQLAFTSESRAGQGECLCVGMTWKTRVAVYIFVLGPKYIVLLVLLWEGSRWLATAMSLCDSLMSAVALQFVIHIDEILYHTLLPAGQQKEVTDTNFFVIEKPKDWDKLVGQLNEQFVLTVKCIVGVVVWMFFYTFVMQDVLPYQLDFLQEICVDYLNFQTSPVCTRLSAVALNEKCYPKGG